MSYFKKPVLLGDLMKSSLHDIAPQVADKLSDMRVIEEWKEMIGPVMGQYSFNEKFENGQLSVNIRSALLKNDLFMQRDAIIKKLNQRIGSTRVLSIYFY